MAVQRIVRGQITRAEKEERARELRRKMTPEENLLWQRLRANRFRGFHFRRQQVIGGFIVDFYCHSAGLVIEVDGSAHQQQEEYYCKRDEMLSSIGLRVLRLTNKEVTHNLENVLLQIAALLTKRTTRRQS